MRHTLHISILLLAASLLPLQAWSYGYDNLRKGPIYVDGTTRQAEYTITGTGEVALGSGRNPCVPFNTAGRVIVPDEIVINSTTYRVTSVASMAFRMCADITYVKIPKYVTRVGDFAFLGCNGLAEVTIPASVTTIGTGAFIDLPSLRAVYCEATTPPVWEYNDVFCFHTGGIGDSRTYRTSSTVLYAPNAETYRQAVYSNATLGWTTPDGWSYFSVIRNISDYEADWGLSISTPYGLLMLRDRVNDGETFSGKLVRLDADLDMSDMPWDKGIGTDVFNSFRGTFDGQGHTISNLSVNAEKAALFGYGYNFTVTNLRLENCSFTHNGASSCSAGAVLAYSMGSDNSITNTYVKNCNVRVITAGSVSSGDVGGLAGYFYGGTIDKCVVDGGTVVASINKAFNVGALVGKVSATNTGITNCAVINSPTLNVSLQNSDTRVGPFVGMSYYNDVNVDYCYNDMRYFNGYTPPEHIVHGNHVLLYGQNVNWPGKGQVEVLPYHIKNYMLPAMVLDINHWVYSVGQYPLPDCFEDLYPEQVNHVTYRPATLTTPRVNALTPSAQVTATAWADMSYRNAAFTASSLHFDDNIDTSSETDLPLGTATIAVSGQVNYDRTLTATQVGEETLTVPIYETDEEGNPVYDEHDARIATGETATARSAIYTRTPYSLCLPYNRTMSNGVSLFQPTQVTQDGDRCLVTMQEKTDRAIVAWQPYYVTVEIPTAPLSTQGPLTITPKPAAATLSLEEGLYHFDGTATRLEWDVEPRYQLQNDHTWRNDDDNDILPFRAFFTAEQGTENTYFTIMKDCVLHTRQQNSAVIGGMANCLVDATLNGLALPHDGSWSALTLPFDVAHLTGTPLEGATVKTLERAIFKEGTLTLDFVDALALKAGTSYLVKWDGNGGNAAPRRAGSDDAPTFSDVIIRDAEPQGTGNETAELVGNYNPTTIAAGSTSSLIITSEGAAEWPYSDTDIDAFQARVALGDGIANNPRSLHKVVVNLGEQEQVITGIGGVSTDARPDDDTWYTIDGRRLSGKPLQPGIYIGHGRKIVVK